MRELGNHSVFICMFHVWLNYLQNSCSLFRSTTCWRFTGFSNLGDFLHVGSKQLDLWTEGCMLVKISQTVDIITTIMDNFCIALFFIRNQITALGRVVSFEACCQWALLSVQITRLVTLPYY